MRRRSGGTCFFCREVPKNNASAPAAGHALSPLGKHARGKRFHGGLGLISGRAVGQYAGKLRDLGNPISAIPPVLFAVEFDLEVHARCPLP